MIHGEAVSCQHLARFRSPWTGRNRSFRECDFGFGAKKWDGQYHFDMIRYEIMKRVLTR